MSKKANLTFSNSRDVPRQSQNLIECLAGSETLDFDPYFAPFPEYVCTGVSSKYLSQKCI